MKRSIKYICLLIASVVVLSLASCAVNRGTPVMTLGDVSVTDHMFEYWMDSYKASLLSAYSDAKDTDSFWSMKMSDGTTAEDFFYRSIYNYIESRLVAMYLFDEFGLEIEQEDIDTAKEIVGELEEYYSGGNRNDFNRELAVYGVNADLLREIFLEEVKSTYLYNYIFENKLLTVGDDEKNEYLRKNYSRVRQIYINDEYDPEASYYDSNGNFVMVPLSDEAKSEKSSKIEEARALLTSGEDFDKVYAEYSEETAYPNGYYLSVSTQGLPQELITNAFLIDVGETADFRSDYGTHIIKRLEMDDGAYANDTNKDFFGTFTTEVYEAVYNKYIATYYDKITVDKAAIEKYTVKSAPANYYFKY